MLGVSDFPESSGTASGSREGEEGGGGAVPGGFEEEERVRGEEGDRNFAGNRWPREETLALLKIRSDMDVSFRDSSLKAPLWEEVSRKLGEFGYQRNAKKCKEKFENIFKYHKRTKEGRSNRQNGKNYRFFEQLQALDNHPWMPPPSPVKIETSTPMPPTNTINPTNASQAIHAVPCSIQKPAADCTAAASTSTTSSSGKESEGSRKRKRKWGVFFENLMKEVTEKQENLHRKFIEAIEKCEQDRIAREEAWKIQELDRIKREQEILVQERSIAAAKDAAVLAFLQKIAEQAGGPMPVPLPENPFSEKVSGKQENSSGENTNSVQLSSSRWPKAEVEALIRLRTNFDIQYQENGPKGPLWEEISLAMRKIGYERSAKRCKEKWENINKYFKRVRDSNKRRADDSKTCPYFHQLDALYKEKTKKVDNQDNNPGYNSKPEDILMQMMRQSEQQRLQSESVAEEGGSILEGGSENVNANQEEEEEEEEEEEDEDGDGDEDGDEDGDGDEDDEADGYQIVANNTSSMAIMG